MPHFDKRPARDRFAVEACKAAVAAVAHRLSKIGFLTPVLAGPSDRTALPAFLRRVLSTTDRRCIRGFDSCVTRDLCLTKQRLSTS